LNGAGEIPQTGIKGLHAWEKKKRKTNEKMVGWDKGGCGITQHDDPGSHTDCTRPSDLEKDPEAAAIACL